MSTNWTTPGNWNINSVPVSGAKIKIPTGAPNYPVLTTNVNCRDLTIEASASVTISPTSSLTVTGKLVNDAGNNGLIIKSNATVTGSLIHNTNNVNGTMECYLPAWPSVPSIAGWHQISSPVNNHALTNFTPSPASDYDFFKWDEATNIWLDQKISGNNINAFISGNAYLVSYANAGTHNFNGALNASEVPLSLNYTSSGPGERGWNHIGNPFTSGLTASINSWAKTNINDYIYVWDDNAANYKTWDGSAGTLTNGIIPAMQGFWVRANASNPSITIPASSRTHSNLNVMKSTPSDVLKLIVNSSANSMEDGLVIRFRNEATNSFDQNYDVPKLFSLAQTSPQLYSISGNEKLSINALASLSNSNMSITLGFEPKINGNYTFTASELSSFNSISKILLEDTKENTTQNLLANQTYNFSATVNDNINRFILHFIVSSIDINESKNSNANIYSYNNQIYVSSNEKINQINIYNALGQLIKTVTSDEASLTINMNNFTSGIYTVSVTTINNTYSEKVFIK